MGKSLSGQKSIETLKMQFVARYPSIILLEPLIFNTCLKSVYKAIVVSYNINSEKNQWKWLTNQYEILKIGRAHV